MRNLLSAAVLSAGTFSGAAFAEPGQGNLVLLPPLDARNVLALTIEGSHNGLAIEQTAPVGSLDANVMTVSITGDRNGRSASADAMPAPLIDGLPWGSLTQVGADNRMEWSVAGTDNLFAAVQRGEGNALQASVTGMGNLAAVSQIGNSNVAAFSQTGNGNMMSITQTSW